MSNLSNKVLYQNGVKVGSEWQKLKTDDDSNFSDSSIFMKINNTTISLVGVLSFTMAPQIDDIVFYLPEYIKLSLENIHDINDFTGIKEFNYLNGGGSYNTIYFRIEDNKLIVDNRKVSSSTYTRQKLAVPINTKFTYDAGYKLTTQKSKEINMSIIK